ncbi:hypothetical protein GGI21_002543 [Coemansia aciculifera]|nr:hypothetical protein GGI21_002543 [Coemansia aciculifera]
MTIAARPIEELAGSQSPLAGAEQQVLREWVAEWTFDLRQFSDRAQPLVRGDIASLRRDFGNLLSHYEEQGMSAAHHTPDHEECLQFLHDIGVAVDATDVAGFTAFMRASQTSQSRLDLAEVLLDMGADVNHRSRFGGVALHEAMMAQDRRAVSFLTRNGASMDIKDNDGISPRDIVTLIL